MAVTEFVPDGDDKGSSAVLNRAETKMPLDHVSPSSPVIPASGPIILDDSGREKKDFMSPEEKAAAEAEARRRVFGG